MAVISTFTSSYAEEQTNAVYFLVPAANQNIVSCFHYQASVRIELNS